jgi:aspartate kinase
MNLRENDLATPVTVMKFGGTSLEDESAFRGAASIVSRWQGSLPIVIASAMSGVTDALLTGLRTAADGDIDTARRSLEDQFKRHLRVAKGLSESANIKTRMLVETTRCEIAELLSVAAAHRKTTARLDDAIASHGERLSANLLTTVLQTHGLPAVYVDARRCIVTNEKHGTGTAKPLIAESKRRSRNQLQPLIANRMIPVLEGFVAATKTGIPSTLGRGSSNYTATLVGAALNAREVQIWTDVDGVLTADPSMVTNPCTIPMLSYAEASELARLGTRVLHPRMIYPARERVIPVRICNSRAPEQTGTLICGWRDVSPGVITAIVHRTNLARIDIGSTPESIANGSLGEIKRIFKRHQTQLDVIIRSEVSISLTCSNAAALSSIAQDLNQIGSVTVEANCGSVSCIGEGLRSRRHEREILQRLNQIDPSLVWHRASPVNLTTVIDCDSLGSIVRRLHQGIFE